MAFLNSLLPERHQIQELEFRNAEFVGGEELDRRVYFDVYCVSARGEHFIVEVQRANQHHFRDRCLYYSTFPIQEQAKRGQWNFELAPVYVIAILDFALSTEDLDDAEEPYLHLVELKDQRGRVFTDKYKQLYIELPRFRKTADQLVDEADRWLYLLRHLAELKQVPPGFSAMVFEKFIGEASLAKLTPDQRKLYRDGIKHSRDLRNVIETSYDNGKGIGAREEAIRTAKALLQAGLIPEDIAVFSSLTVTELELLAQDGNLL